jgi:hypothetical protein
MTYGLGNKYLAVKLIFTGKSILQPLYLAKTIEVDRIAMF